MAVSDQYLKASQFALLSTKNSAQNSRFTQAVSRLQTSAFQNATQRLEALKPHHTVVTTAREQSDIV
jgi:hypothetical protein